MKVLVVGRSGQLASELVRTAWPPGTQVIAMGRPELIVEDATSVARSMDRNFPDLVVNASAFTQVDRAESESATAFAVNRDGPRNLAHEAAAKSIPLIHVSTDYVFDGPTSRPWDEGDKPNPRGAYAVSKLEGEVAVRAETSAHVVLRTSWLFAAHGTNFVRTMLNLSVQREELAVVADQIGCPTSAADLATVIVRIAAALSGSAPPYGTYHYSGKGPTSWYGFAEKIFENAGDLAPRRPRLRAITTAEYAAIAPRPAYSVLDCSKLARDYHIAQASWLDGLSDVLSEIRQERLPT